MEFVIEQEKRDIVEKFRLIIQERFNVNLSLANGTGNKIWITLIGEHVDKARSYVKALTNPEKRQEIAIPASLVNIFAPQSKEHIQLESEYGVYVEFPTPNKAIISGDTIEVTILAVSRLENLILNHQANSKTQPTEAKTFKSDKNRALEDFALKLGYEQSQINMVFENLGHDSDKNTFLNELINVSGASTRIAEPPCRPVPRQVQPQVYMNNHLYHNDTGVNCRSAVRRTSTANTLPHYANQPYNPTIDGLNVYPHNLEGYPAQVDSVRRISPTPRTTPSFIPQSTSPSLNNPSSSNIISRGLTMSQSTRDNSCITASLPNLMNGSYDHQHVDQLVDQVASRCQQQPQSNLRHVVIDGSNVAMSHGNNKVFSCRGILLCVNWFRQRGHTQITVFVPSWRKESAKMDNPIMDQQILKQLEDQNFLTFTPSRKVNGRRIVCYDDRFIVRLADRTDGIIVSNDNFKDLAAENPKWRDVIERRLLMYSFVNDMFMPPDDPLGRHGPTLDEFLQKGTAFHRRVCPYGRRCTYGNRCKYYHPEREENRAQMYNRLQMYNSLQALFPKHENLIQEVMRMFPNETDANTLATKILNKMH